MIEMNRIDKDFLKKYKGLNKTFIEEYDKNSKIFEDVLGELYYLINSKYEITTHSTGTTTGDILFGLGETFNAYDIEQEKKLYFEGFL